MTRYPMFARYQMLREGGLYVAINGRGAVVVFQQISAANNEADARCTFESESLFNAAYVNALAGTKRVLNVAFEDFEESFFLAVGGGRLEISWNRVVIPVCSEQPWRMEIFIEAMFVFALCKASENCLAQLLLGSSVQVQMRNLLEYARDIISIERPDHYLVNSAEIEFMKQFYDGWGLGDYAKSLQSRFSQTIETFNLHYNQIQARRAASLNRFVAAVTVLALIPIADKLSMPSLGFTESRSLAVIFAVAGVLVCFGSFSQGLASIAALVWRFRNEWPLERRVRRLLRR